MLRITQERVLLRKWEVTEKCLYKITSDFYSQHNSSSENTIKCTIERFNRVMVVYKKISIWFMEVLLKIYKRALVGFHNKLKVKRQHAIYFAKF